MKIKYYESITRNEKGRFEVVDEDEALDYVLEKLGLEIKGITILLKKIELIGNDGIFKYMYTIQRKAYKILSALKITNIQRFDYQG